MDITKLLNNIKDPGQRMQIQNILTGNIVKVVRCMSKSCNGRIVANVYASGKIEPVFDEEDGKMYLRASRNRLDGYLGFQCWCGNDSRLCDAEIGVSGIENNAPQKSDLETVWNRLQKRPVNYPERDGKQDIDNFRIETIK